jgi:toxin FitB
LRPPDRAATRRLSAASRSKRAWYDEFLVRFADLIEPIDLQVAQKWAEVSVRFPSLRNGDKAIAATAIAKDYGVATRNLRDFQQAGVPLVDPLDPGT